MVDFSWLKWVGSMNRKNAKKVRKAKIARVGQVEGLEDRALLTSSFAISNPSIVEGNAGTTTNLVFTVTLTRDVADAAVNFAVDAKSLAAALPTDATPAVDFVAVSLAAADAPPDALQFPGNGGVNPVNVQTFSVTINGDNLDEVNETFKVQLSNVTGGVADLPNSGIGVGTITDDDPQLNPFVRITTKAAGIAEAGATFTDVNVALVDAAGNAVITSQPVTVNLAYTGTADNPADYIKAVQTGSGTPDALVIPAGNGAASVRITAQDDSTDEVNESVLVDIVSATVAGGTATEFTGVVGGVNETSQQEIVTITDNDATAPGASTPNVSIFVSSPTFTEAAGTIDVTLSLSVPALPGGMTVMLDYSTIVGGVPPTATKGVDYTVAVGPSGNTAGTTIKEFNGTAGSAQQQIFIPAGAQQAVLRLTAVDDTLSEINEAITVAIVAPGGATQGVAGGGQAGAAGISSTITDNDGNGTPSVSLSFINPTTGIITEAGATATTLVATLSSVSNVPVTVTLDMPAARANAVAGDIVVAPGVSRDSNGTATGATAFGAAPAPANFPTIGTPGSIVIPAGSISASFIINAVDGAADDEVTETFATDITNVTNGTELGNQSVTATIIDNDPPVATPTVAMTINAPSLTSIDETGVGAGATTTVTLTLGGAAGGPAGNLTTVLLTFGGGATLGTDYITNLAVPNQISFPAAAAIGSTVTFTITSLADNQDEPNEAVVVDIVEVANGTEALTPGQQQVTATIVDDDATVVPNVSIAGTPATIAEAAGSATITATLSATTSVNVTVPITFSGSATNGTDFTPSAATITIPAGSTTGSITVTALQDALDEIDEAIIATMGAVTGATATGGAVTTTITDDDPLANPTVTLTTSASSIAEAAGTATLTATLSTIASVPVTVNLAYTGTATNGTDYATGPTSIVVPAGSLTGTAVLTATQDTKDEPDETIIATVSSVTGTGTATAQSVTVTITDDDLQAQPNVTLSASPAALSEATVGTTSTITATLSEASSVDITVAIAFTGTATITSDFTASGSSIVIPAGSTTGTITLTAVNDPADEADSETIIATISSLTGTTGTGTGQNTTVTIADDDATVVPNVTLSATPLTIDEAGGKSTVTATLSATTSVPVTVNLAYTGTATNVTDYTRSTAQIVVAPGTTTGTAVITAVQDATDEPDETVIVDIDTVPGGNEATPQTVTVTITDDDVNLPPVAADTTAKVNAGASVTVTPTATDGNAGDVLVFSIATQGTKGTAVLNVDGTITYTANAGTTGTDTVTFSVTDGALSDTGDIVITINAIPTAADQTVAVNAGETVIGVLGGSDTEAGALTFNAVGTVAGLIVGSGGAFSYTAAEWGDLEVFDQLRLDPFYRYLAQARPEAAGYLHTLIEQNLTESCCMVLADFSPKNILLSGDRIGLVDFETGHYGDPAFDLGFFLSHLLLKAVKFADRFDEYADLTTRFWQRYHTGMPQRELPDQLQLDRLFDRTQGHLAGCMWARIDGKSPVDYLTDESTRQHVRDFCLSLFQTPARSWPETLQRLRNPA